MLFTLVFLFISWFPVVIYFFSIITFWFPWLISHNLSSAKGIPIIFFSTPPIFSKSNFSLLFLMFSNSLKSISSLEIILLEYATGDVILYVIVSSWCS